MALTSEQKIKSHTGVSAHAAKRIEQFLDEAALLLQDLISKSLYEDLEAAPTNDEKKLIAERAESYLCVYAALPFLNLRFTDLGGLSKIIGFGDRSEELMSQYESAKYQAAIWSRVQNLVRQIVDENAADDNFIGNGFAMTAVKGCDYD